MSSSAIEQEYTDTRLKGLKALKTILKQDKKIKIVEKCIHKQSSKNEQYENTYRKILYQTIGDLILDNKLEKTEKNIKLKETAKNIKHNKIGWNHPIYTQIKNRIEEHDDFIINPFEVEEGVTNCKACGSTRVFTYSKQVRSCDEPMTTVAKCVKCKVVWTYSG